MLLFFRIIKVEKLEETDNYKEENNYQSFHYPEVNFSLCTDSCICHVI